MYVNKGNWVKIIIKIDQLIARMSALLIPTQIQRHPKKPTKGQQGKNKDNKSSKTEDTVNIVSTSLTSSTTDDVVKSIEQLALSPSPSEIATTKPVVDNHTDNDDVIIDNGPLLIDTVELCVKVCRILQNERMLSVDLEGVNLGREGKISILQIATRQIMSIPLPTTTTTPTTTWHTKVFLFDITTLKSSAFEEGKLKGALLQNGSIVKLLYDLRKDADALFYQFNCRLNNIIDLQILYFETFTKHYPDYRLVQNERHHSGRNSGGRGGGQSGRGGSNGKGQSGKGGGQHNNGRGGSKGSTNSGSQHTVTPTKTASSSDKSTPDSTPPSSAPNNGPIAKRVTGYKKALERVLLRPSSSSSPATTEQEAEYHAMEEIKERGVKLFAPEFGGSYEVWETRPLHPDLIVYCKNDVVKLFDMYDAWMSSLPLKDLRDYSNVRLQRTLARQPQWESKDPLWTLPDWD